jgi:hypothetical protein
MSNDSKAEKISSQNILEIALIMKTELGGSRRLLMFIGIELVIERWLMRAIAPNTLTPPNSHTP